MMGILSAFASGVGQGMNEVADRNMQQANQLSLLQAQSDVELNRSQALMQFKQNLDDTQRAQNAQDIDDNMDDAVNARMTNQYGPKYDSNADDSDLPADQQAVKARYQADGFTRALAAQQAGHYEEMQQIAQAAAVQSNAQTSAANAANLGTYYNAIAANAGSKAQKITPQVTASMGNGVSRAVSDAVGNNPIATSNDGRAVPDDDLRAFANSQIQDVVTKKMLAGNVNLNPAQEVAQGMKVINAFADSVTADAGNAASQYFAKGIAPEQQSAFAAKNNIPKNALASQATLANYLRKENLTGQNFQAWRQQKLAPTVLAAPQPAPGAPTLAAVSGSDLSVRAGGKQYQDYR